MFLPPTRSPLEFRMTFPTRTKKPPRSFCLARGGKNLGAASGPKSTDRHRAYPAQLQRAASPNHAKPPTRLGHGMRDNLIQLALDQPTLSPRELAVLSTDTESCPSEPDADGSP